MSYVSKREKIEKFLITKKIKIKIKTTNKQQNNNVERYKRATTNIQCKSVLKEVKSKERSGRPSEGEA